MGKLIKLLVVLILAGGIGYGAWFYYNKLYLAPQKEAKQEAALPSVPAPPPPDPGNEPYAQALELKKAGKVEDARLALEQLLVNYPESKKVEAAKQVLGELNADLFFRGSGTDVVRYTVQKGDSLFKIAGKQKCSAELLVRCNNLESTLLQLGQELVIPQGQFSLFINAGDRAVVLYRDNRFFREYKATSGKVAMPPAGGVTTKVADKVAWKGGKRIAFDSKDYMGSTRWIQIATSGYDLFTDWGAEAPQHADMPRPSTGLGLSQEAIEELSALVNRGTEVYIR